MDDEVSGLIASPGTYAQSPLFLHGPSPVLRIPTITYNTRPTYLANQIRRVSTRVIAATQILVRVAR